MGVSTVANAAHSGGGFNRSLQHLEREELGWVRGRGDRLIVRCGRRCGRQVVRRGGGVSIWSGSGKASRVGCRVGKPLWQLDGLLLSGPVGSGRVGDATI